MNDRRMFSRGIITSDKFTDMSPLAQLVYVRACLEADDEGFLPSLRAVARMVGASSNEVETLIENGFVIVFESGVTVITDWKIHNSNLRADRTTPSIFSEKSLVVEMPNKRYQLKEDDDKKVKDFEKSSKKVKKSEKCGAREEKRREDKIRECVVSRARAERACAAYSDSVLEKSSEENEKPETEPNRGDFFKGALFTFDKDHIEPGLYEQLLKMATEADEVVKNGAEEGATIPFHILTDAPEESKKATLDVLYDEYTKGDVAERQVDGLIFGRRALGDTTDYETHRAAYLDLTRQYGAREVLKAVEIALEAGHGGEVPYIRGVLRRRAS